MNNLIWILVASATDAVIYSTYKMNLFKSDLKKIHFVKRYSHAESRQKDVDLVSDKYGKFNQGTFTERTDPHQHEEELFAIELAKVLTKGHTDKEYRESIIIAPATFMGYLNKHLSREVNELAYLKIEKDYARFNEEELVKHLQDYL